MLDSFGCKLFCDLVALKSFSEAAAKNNVTQSALSQRLKKMESAYGRLVNRSDLSVTEAGTVVWRACQVVVAVEEQMLASLALFGLSKPQGE